VPSDSAPVTLSNAPARRRRRPRRGVSIYLPAVEHAQALALLLEHVGDDFEPIRVAIAKALERRERRAA
jgi:hypothetical protein